MRGNNGPQINSPYPPGRDPYYEVEVHYPPYGDPYGNQRPPIIYSAQGSKGGMFSFTPREVRELLISIAVLTFAFAKVLGEDRTIVENLIPAFIAVFTGFFLHEMGHKFMAQSYGLFTEFRMSEQGLMLAFITSFFGFLIAAPGAVVISGYPTRAQSGKTAIAGPGTNIAIAAIAAPFVFAGGEVAYTAELVLFINAFLALFNLIPYHPLDGEKIVKWSVPFYVLTVVMALSFFIGGLMFI